MGSGYSMESMFPPWAGVVWTYVDGSGFAPYPDDPWSIAWFQGFEGSWCACQGRWPGDSRSRWAWFHGTVTSPVLTPYYWDAILGDHLHLVEADFRAAFDGPLVYKVAPGSFTPYA